ncbi:MAG: hypothetical protein AAFX92_20460, partial [Pseudomonadota bacterium]
METAAAECDLGLADLFCDSDNGLGEEDMTFTEGALLEVIRHYTRESGVRGLERELASVARKVATFS